MPELIHELTSHLTSLDGIVYHVWVLGERQADGLWHGWIEFHPPGSAGALTTRRLTTQVSRSALYYWGRTAGGGDTSRTRSVARLPLNSTTCRRWPRDAA